MFPMSVPSFVIFKDVIDNESTGENVMALFVGGVM
jgi:hypothetical protein